MPATYLVNGTIRPWQDDLTVQQVLDGEPSDGAWCAVAVNGAVVPSSQWATTPVPVDAEIDVIQPCQGG